jgi:hypothetical protein
MPLDKAVLRILVQARDSFRIVANEKLIGSFRVARDSCTTPKAVADRL